MTQEDKDLLFKVLCATAPYKIQVLEDIDKEFDGGFIGEVKAIFCKDRHIYTYGSLTPMTIEEVRPYLRPMSSMTEEEVTEFDAFRCLYCRHAMMLTQFCNLANETNMFDWLNSHHFDFLNLIQRGLALEAPEGMYL